ncbi:MAG: protein kinase, partial [Bacteroidota bacterium]
DTKLDRVVALKFLPEQATATEEERARFLQEAKSAATLNHPNVCTIHGIDEYEEPASGDAPPVKHHFIEMECVDGVTLRTKIPKDGLKLQDAVDYAIQIGEALQEAHSKGIVHRDVKAENVMLNTKNQIKVMDFGLAKLRGTTRLTQTSSTIGTLAYMAPEQIQGEEVDSRSDIFSYGVLLYEMLTGRSPFRGEHEAALVYSIVNEDPHPMDQIRTDVPQTIIHLINRSLEKDPADRYQSMSEIVGELRHTKKQSARVSRTVPVQKPAAHVSEVTADVPTEPVSAGEPRTEEPKRKWVLPAAAGAAVVLAGLLFLVLSGGGPTLNPDMTFRVLQLPHSEIEYPGLSPDGNWIAYPASDANGKWDVYYMNASVGEPRRVTTDSSFNIGFVDVSPDGGKIVYERSDGQGERRGIYVVSSLGGQSRKVAQGGGSPRWRPDGLRIAFLRSGTTTPYPSESGDFELWSVQPDGRDERRELIDTIGTGWNRISYAWSPDATSFAWLRTFPEGNQEIVIRNLASGEERQLTSDGTSIDEVFWLSNDQIVFSSNRTGNTNIWVVPSSGGEPVQITKGSGPDLGIKASADARTLLYLQQQNVGNIWTAALDGTDLKQVTFDERHRLSPSFSPDAGKIAYVMAASDPLTRARYLYVSDRFGGDRRQLTSGDELVSHPRWSPDGKWIVYAARPTGEVLDSSRIYLVDAANPGVPTEIGKGWAPEWISPDTLVVAHLRKSWYLDVDGSPQRPVSPDSFYAFPLRKVSHTLIWDWRFGNLGWWLASGLPSDPAIFERAERLPVPTVPLRMSPDEEFFYYARRAGELWRYSVSGRSEELVPGNYPGIGSSFSFSSDGREIIYTDERLSAKLVMVENLFE